MRQGIKNLDCTGLEVSKDLEFDTFIDDVRSMILPTGVNIVGIVENTRYARTILPERVSIKTFVDSVNRQLAVQGGRHELINGTSTVYLTDVCILK